MVTIKLRRGPSSEWFAENPVLADGEVGIESAPGVLPDKGKIGDGVTVWNNLPYSVASDWLPLAEKGVSGGVATLDGNGFVPMAQLPNAAALDAEVTAAVAAETAARTAAISALNGTYVAWTDVTAHGATGNGVTDDTVAIQAAIDVFKGNNSTGGTVYFPRGTYRITAPLQLSVGGTNATSHFSVRLLGAGPAAGTNSTGPAAVKGVSRIFIDGAIVGIVVGNASLTEFNGPSFENLTIVDKNGTATGGISLERVDRWKVSDCTFWNFQAGYGIYTKHTGSIPDPLVQNTWFIRCLTGILLQRGDFLKVKDCTFEAQIAGASAVQAGYRGIVADTDGNLDTLRVVDTSFRNCEVGIDLTNQIAGPGQEFTNCRFEVFTTAIQLSTASQDVSIWGGDFNNAAIALSGTVLAIPAGALRTKAFLGSVQNVSTVLSDSGSDTVFLGVGGASSTDPGLMTLPTRVALRQGVNTVSGDAFLASERYLLADATAAPRTITLPDVATFTRYGSRRGQAYTIKKIDDSTNTVTITTSSSQKIDGVAADIVLTQPGEYVTLISGLYPSSDASWDVVARGVPSDPRFAAAASRGQPPTGVLTTTVARNTALSTASSLATGRETLSLVYLQAGQIVTGFAAVTGGTGVTTPTNQWFSLRNAARQLLTITPDDTTTAWGPDVRKALTLAAPYTVLTSGWYYVGMMITATGVGVMACVTQRSAVTATPPINVGYDNTNTGLTTPATAPATSAALTIAANLALPYIEVIGT